MTRDEIIERKWKQHRQTDERESMIDEYEKANGLLTPEQLEKVRKIYDSYIEEGREFKPEYIDIIKSIVREKKKIKRIELEER